MSADADATPIPPNEPHAASRLFLRSPSPPISIGLVLGLSLLLGAILERPGAGGLPYLELSLLAFAAPALIAAALTPPIARALGGRMESYRSLFLSVTALLAELPFALVGRGFAVALPAAGITTVGLVLFVGGPGLWLRHMSLFGLSRPAHAPTLPASLVQPIAAVGLLELYSPLTPLELAFAAGYLALGFAGAALLLRAVDRPLSREFHSSGLAMMRPLLDHVNLRDPEATRTLERFFLRAAIPMDLKVRVLTFEGEGRRQATIALPTVHPGPFGALGASDLPRKLSGRLGSGAGTVFVPHTPCDHDVDLPSDEELDKVADGFRDLLGHLPPPRSARASPLVRPYAGSLARAQLLGDVALVLVSQAPEPTDDISLAVADRIVREAEETFRVRVALIDAHNSYVEDRGDIFYGTPAAEKLVADALAAIGAAIAAAKDGPIEIGTATKTDYQLSRDGIAAHGLRVLAVRAAGATSAYLLIDGNNLMAGLRAPLLAALAPLVTEAEVMTTDNHVVHESDGSTNPVGARYDVSALARDAEALVRSALAALTPVEVRYASGDVPGVRVLGPGFTARLLTSIADSVSMFGNASLLTYLLVLAGSLVLLSGLPGI